MSSSEISVAATTERLREMRHRQERAERERDTAQRAAGVQEKTNVNLRADIEKAEAELVTELLANAGLLHQLTEAERERDEARARYSASHLARATATIARIEALVVRMRDGYAGEAVFADELQAVLKGDA